MDAGDERSRLLADLQESLCREADIEFAVTFGSQVSDDAHTSFDLDIAIKFADDLSPHERFQKRCFLSGDLQREAAPLRRYLRRRRPPGRCGSRRRRRRVPLW